MEDTLAPAAQGLFTSFLDKSREASSSFGIFVQAASGAGTALISTAAAIPVGLSIWVERVAREIPRGPAATIYRFVEVPLRGLAEGAAHLVNTADAWGRGELFAKDSFSIAFEVTSALGTAALIFLGARGISRGGMNAASMAGGAGGALSIGGNSLALSFSSAASPALASIAAPAAFGAVLCAAAGESGGGEGKGPSPDFSSGKIDLTEVVRKLQEYDGDTTKVMVDLGISRGALIKCIRTLRRNGVLLPKLKRNPIRVESPGKTTVAEIDLAESLRRNFGDRAKVGSEMGLDAREIQRLILNSHKGSPLDHFKPFKVTEAQMLDALMKSKGNLDKAGRRLGISPRRIDEAIIDAKPGSALAEYRPVTVSDGVLADALARNGGSLSKAANELGMFLEDAYFQVVLADRSGPLFRFKRKLVKKSTN